MGHSAPFPRTTLRNILRSHSATSSTTPKQLSSRVEAVAWIAYLAHLKRLAREVKLAQGLEEGKKAEGGRRSKVGAADVGRASKRTLKKSQGRHAELHRSSSRSLDGKPDQSASAAGRTATSGQPTRVSF